MPALRSNFNPLFLCRRFGKSLKSSFWTVHENSSWTFPLFWTLLGHFCPTRFFYDVSESMWRIWKIQWRRTWNEMLLWKRGHLVWGLRCRKVCEEWKRAEKPNGPEQLLWWALTGVLQANTQSAFVTRWPLLDGVKEKKKEKDRQTRQKISDKLMTDTQAMYWCHGCAITYRIAQRLLMPKSPESQLKKYDHYS